MIRDCENCGIAKDAALKPENAQPPTCRHVGSDVANVDVVFTESWSKKVAVQIVDLTTLGLVHALTAKTLM